jgi:hypothetical protein
MNMLYSILIYGDEAHVAGFAPEKLKEVLDRHAGLRRDLNAKNQLGPVVRLNPEGARTVRRYKERPSVTDGPYAETKEQLMGIYIVDVPTFEDAVAATKQLDFESGVFEIRTLMSCESGNLQV